MDFPKIDLHLHLDGSLDPLLAYQLARKKGLKEGQMDFAEFKQKMIAPPHCKDLADYLACFDLPIRILQDEEALANSAYDLIGRLAQQGVEYAEIRFAPQNHTGKGMSMEDSVLAVLRGADLAMEAHPEIEVGIILCMMILGDTSNNDKENMETVRLVKKYLGRGVVCLDLAGAEGMTPMRDYKKYFDYANELGVPFVIHAGECGPAEHVSMAMDFGAKRIGHGGHCTWDEKVLNRVIAEKIPLEMCVTSNIQCKNQPSYSAHVLKELYTKGAITTINTDNMTLSNITLQDEYDHIMKELGLSEKDIIRMNINSVQASFAGIEKKAELLKKLHCCLDRLD